MRMVQVGVYRAFFMDIMVGGSKIFFILEVMSPDDVSTYGTWLGANQKRKRLKNNEIGYKETIPTNRGAKTTRRKETMENKLGPRN